MSGKKAPRVEDDALRLTPINAGAAGAAAVGFDDADGDLHEGAGDLSFGYLLALNAYNFSNQLVLLTAGVVLLPSEAKRLFPEKAAVMLGCMLAVTGVTQLICPLVGFYSDRCTSKYGRRRPFIFWGAVIAIFGFVVMWFAREILSGEVYCLGLFVNSIGLNIAYAGFTVINADFVPEPLMGKASGAMAVQALCGASLGFGLLGFVFVNDMRSAYPMYIAALIGGTAITCIAAQEKPITTKSTVTKADLIACYKITPTTHGDFFWVFVMRSFYYMSLSVQAFMLYYLVDCVYNVGGPEGSYDDDESIEEIAHTSLAIIVLGSLCGGAVVTVPMGWCSDKYGRKNQVIWSCIFIASVFAVFVAFPPVNVLFALGVLYGMGNGAFLVVDYAIAIDCLPDKTQVARDLGLWGVGAFLGTAFGPMLLGPLLYFIGNEGSGHYSKAGYQVIFIASVGFILASAAFVAKIKGST
jgi:MFS family permease